MSVCTTDTTSLPDESGASPEGPAAGVDGLDVSRGGRLTYDDARPCGRWGRNPLTRGKALTSDQKPTLFWDEKHPRGPKLKWERRLRPAAVVATEPAA
jgi:hypothetical protein